MKILAYNPGHDGAIAYIRDAKLVFSIEAEKDSHYRNSSLSVPHILDALGQIGEMPDVICRGGWWPSDHHEYLFGSLHNSGYRGVERELSIVQRGRFFQGRTHYFSSTHERSHVLCALGMSGFVPENTVYVLVWEGGIGAFYEVDPDFNVTLVGEVMDQPGNRYGLLYGLADPTFSKDEPYPRLSDAGKLMALASFSTRDEPSDAERKLLSFLLDGPSRKLSDYDGLENAPHLNVGLSDPEFRNFAGIYSDAIFDRFYRFAVEKMKSGRPLIIAGGCGLNCDWNSQWQKTGFFSNVFVTPVANDSGSAIGTAIDAQLHFTGSPTIEWTVYSGLPFDHRGQIDKSQYDIRDFDSSEIASLLANDLILAWANGNYEIGPRALGNRSILAAPFKERTRVRLNEIKNREQYRPIAPLCLQEDAHRWFGCDHHSPHMLFTYRATTDALAAVTHVNGTARLQTVTRSSNSAIYDLLTAFKASTGYGVLCNTSLNFHGKGFINNLSDLDTYVTHHNLDGFVLEGKTYLLKASTTYQAFLRSAANAARDQ
ncbi:carbamoyltransferase C-terminal domain-containing protein [Brucella pituitosa]|uniref:carbamoyltransferase C-terminal domain-containing protein n=1 Tax=Brucella pituitosa TaxID=571256 RepID=UPI000CFF0049|nr:proline dehydrogenase [Ochrobactrum sp. MYb68]